MQKLIICCSLCLSVFTNINGQTDNEKKYFKEEFSDTLKNESVVIVKDYEEYKITKLPVPDYKVNVVLRTQYKLKDFSAVESFNTMSKSKGLRKIIITQIKPDGTVNEIYIYEDKNYNENKSQYNVRLNEGGDKLAVENLEIGDIIDYRYEYSYTTTVYPYTIKELENGRVYGVDAIVKNYNTFRKLPDFTKFLQEKYPTLSALCVLETPNELKLLQKALNCSYKFTETKDSDGKMFKCRFGYNKAYKSEYFSYSYVDLPVVKFCVVNTANAKMQNMYPYQFLDESISDEDIADLGRLFYLNKKFMPHYIYYLDTKKYSKGYADASLSAFFGAFLKTFAKDNTDQLDVLNKFHEYISNNDEINNWQFGKMNFAVLMARFCDKIKQPYKMMACLHKYDGSWDKVIHPSEINWGIFIENGKEDLFITSTESASSIYDREGSLAGTSVILFNPKDASEAERMTYPSIDYKENKMMVKSEINLVDVKKNYDYHFNNTVIHTGALKKNIDDNIAYKFYPERLSTHPDFQGIVSYNLYNDEIYRDTGKFLPEFRRISASYDSRFDRMSKENFENYLYSEYHFKKITMDSFRIISGEGYADDGQTENKFKVEFKAENVIENTTNGQLILKLGRLITEQMEISNFKNNERVTNINITNQKEINWDISIEIPEGYKPLNLEDFNQKFENSTGIFNASAVQEGNQLVLKIDKIYKINFLPKEKWSEVTTFLKQAVLFYEKRLLLEKK